MKEGLGHHRDVLGDQVGDAGGLSVVQVELGDRERRSAACERRAGKGNRRKVAYRGAGGSVTVAAEPVELGGPPEGSGRAARRYLRLAKARIGLAHLFLGRKGPDLAAEVDGLEADLERASGLVEEGQPP